MFSSKNCKLRLEQSLFMNMASSSTLQLTEHVSILSKTKLQASGVAGGQAGCVGLSGHLEHWWPAGVQASHTAWLLDSSNVQLHRDSGVLTSDEYRMSLKSRWHYS